MKKVIFSFVSLGLDQNDPNKECLDIYKEHFETPFIESSEQYYKKESEAFLAENTVSEYLKKAEERLREEEDRVERYLHTKTRKDIIAKCEHVLIREHAELMWESFQKLLDFDQDADLQRMYALLARIPEGLEPLRKRFEAHVKQSGLSSVAKLTGEGTTNVDTLDPKVYVDALLEVHRKNAETVSRSFKSEAGFAASLDKACREFVNKNGATGSSSNKSPELIAKHADMLLRKNNKMAEEEDLESALNRVVSKRHHIAFLLLTDIAPDDLVQVPRGQGRFPNFLHHQAVEASNPRCLRLRRERSKHDLQTQGSLWVRVHQQAAAHVHRFVNATFSST